MYQDMSIEASTSSSSSVGRAPPIELPALGPLVMACRTVATEAEAPSGPAGLRKGGGGGMMRFGLLVVLVARWVRPPREPVIKLD